MKKQSVMALLAGMMLTVSVQAASSKMPKPVMDGQPGLPVQTAEWWDQYRQALAAQEARGGQSNDQAAGAEVNFYTGKPYDAEIGGYVFKYRNYSPEMQRWTTTDPSGFPDGANNYCYAASPLRELDPDGRLTITGVITPNLAVQTVQYDGHTYQITANMITVNNVSNALLGNQSINTYTAWNSGNTGGVEIRISMAITSSIENITFHWLQQGFSSDTGRFLDNVPGGGAFYYDEGGNSGLGGTANALYFYDNPNRYLTLATKDNPNVSWFAILDYVGVNNITNIPTSYSSISYGFQIKFIE